MKKALYYLEINFFYLKKITYKSNQEIYVDGKEIKSVVCNEKYYSLRYWFPTNYNNRLYLYQKINKKKYYEKNIQKDNIFFGKCLLQTAYEHFILLQ